MERSECTGATTTEEGSSSARAETDEEAEHARQATDTQRGAESLFEVCCLSEAVPMHDDDGPTPPTAAAAAEVGAPPDGLCCSYCNGSSGHDEELWRCQVCGEGAIHESCYADYKRADSSSGLWHGLDGYRYGTMAAAHHVCCACRRQYLASLRTEALQRKQDELHSLQDLLSPWTLEARLKQSRSSSGATTSGLGGVVLLRRIERSIRFLASLNPDRRVRKTVAASLCVVSGCLRARELLSSSSPDMCEVTDLRDRLLSRVLAIRLAQGDDDTPLVSEALAALTDASLTRLTNALLATRLAGSEGDAAAAVDDDTGKVVAPPVSTPSAAAATPSATAADVLHATLTFVTS